MFSSTKARKIFRVVPTYLLDANQIELTRDNHSQGASFKYFNGQEGGRVNPHSYPRLPRRELKVLLRGQSASMNKGFTRQNFLKKNLGGFTLIELLVVITIIGILAGVILVAMGSAREKAKDVRIKTNMLQIQNLAEGFYLDEGNYGNFDCSVVGPDCLCSDEALEALCEDIYTQGSSLTIEKPSSSPVDQYCSYADLISGSYLCVDSGGDVTETIDPGITCNPGGPFYTCQ